MQKTKEATPTTKEERAALTATIRMREKEVSEEKKRVDLLHGEYSYEVRIAMQDQHSAARGWRQHLEGCAFGVAPLQPNRRLHLHRDGWAGIS
jgi:hypothetical protein